MSAPRARLALLSIPALALARTAGAAVDLNAEIEQRIRGADSARVVRVREPRSGEICLAGEDHLDDFIVEREGRAQGMWTASMAQALVEAVRRFPAPVICPRERGQRPIRFGVQFFTGPRRTTIILYLAERCFEFWTARTFEGSAEMHDIAPRILALLKRAFPADTTVQHLDLKGLISCEDYMREHPEGSLLVQPPEPIRRVPPRYPKEARKARIEGEVLVQAWVGVDGQVGETRVLRSVPGLDAAAVAAVRQWQFEPALDCWRQPVATWVALPVAFKLD